MVPGESGIQVLVVHRRCAVVSQVPVGLSHSTSGAKLVCVGSIRFIV